MKIKKEKLKTFIYPAAFILIALLSLAYKLLVNGTGDTFISTIKGESIIMPSDASYQDTEQTAEPSLTEDTSAPAMVQVYICGAVAMPGVYELPEGVILNDVVECAGGFTENADITKINLVYEIDSNVSVFIPDCSQTDESVSEAVFEIQSDIIRDDDEYLWGEDTGSQQESASLVNINTAGKEELMTLPGIGEVYAQSIIDYRETAPFASIEEIKNVSGIGDVKFDKIKAYITV